MSKHKKYKKKKMGKNRNIYKSNTTVNTTVSNNIEPKNTISNKINKYSQIESNIPFFKKLQINYKSIKERNKGYYFKENVISTIVGWILSFVASIIGVSYLYSNNGFIEYTSETNYKIVVGFSFLIASIILLLSNIFAINKNAKLGIHLKANNVFKIFNYIFLAFGIILFTFLYINIA